MVVKEDGMMSVWKEKKLLGSGSSAEVYEYVNDNNKSKAVKLFKWNCSAHFFKEVYIYQCLQDCDVSLMMEWYRSDRLMICMDGVQNVIEISTVSKEAVRQLYASLETFHTATSYIHKDIYVKNILQSSDGKKLFLIDFGLACFKGKPSFIEGNPFFASNRVLECKEDKFLYDVCDDLFSLTFSFIYLKNNTLFSDIFKDINFSDKKGIIASRNHGIERLGNSQNAMNALKASENKDYGGATEWIIKCLF
jgi:serine/threonine protein kinase